jgi:hypothetical protein
MTNMNLKSALNHWGCVALLGAVGVLGAAGDAAADDTLRCKQRLISAGNVPYEVKSLCGDPDDIQTRTEVRSFRRIVSVPCARGTCQSYVDEAVTVNVEEWVYDFGPQRFIQYLTFESGKLVKIRSGSYGRKLQ